MKHLCTQNDLIRFLYKETNASETIAISEALCENPVLANQYEELLKGYQMLPRAKFSPSSSAIQNILGYSNEAKPVGFF
ncbi:MAG: hypothetical protein ACI9XO_003692 [Paraglaciecola sp.]|jgi:hypothetical protein